MSDLTKRNICDTIYDITVNMSDLELEYAMKIMQFWVDERKAQEKELESEIENYLNDIREEV